MRNHKFISNNKNTMKISKNKISKKYVSKTMLCLDPPRSPARRAKSRRRSKTRIRPALIRKRWSELKTLSSVACFSSGQCWHCTAQNSWMYNEECSPSNPHRLRRLPYYRRTKPHEGHVKGARDRWRGATPKRRLSNPLDTPADYASKTKIIRRF